MSVRARTPASPRESAARGKAVERKDANALGDPGRLTLEHRARRFGGEIARGEAGAAGGEHEVGDVAVAPGDELRGDRGDVVGDEGTSYYGVATSGGTAGCSCITAASDPLRDRIARSIHQSLAARAGVADREYRNSHPAICRVRRAAAKSAFERALSAREWPQRKPGTAERWCAAVPGWCDLEASWYCELLSELA